LRAAAGQTFADPQSCNRELTRHCENGARDLFGSLVVDGIIGSDTPKGPVSLRFPLDAIEILFPSLFPET
jgi:hypothetical protein